MDTEKKKKWLAIGVFYSVALAIRYLSLKIGFTGFNNPRYWIVAWAEGIGPCLGALAAVSLLKRRFFCSITGTSVIRSALTVAVPFTVCFMLHRELSFILLGFIFYSFFEEVGWRGYLQGELRDESTWFQVLVIGTMWLLWHLTIGFNIGTLIFWGILLFGSWGIGRVASDTHSLMACACFHVLYNFSNKGMFEFDALVITLYVCVIASWFLIWYLPWDRWLGKRPRQKRQPSNHDTRS